VSSKSFRGYRADESGIEDIEVGAVNHASLAAVRKSCREPAPPDMSRASQAERVPKIFRIERQLAPNGGWISITRAGDKVSQQAVMLSAQRLRVAL
jgi:hypothetical protein